MIPMLIINDEQFVRQSIALHLLQPAAQPLCSPKNEQFVSRVLCIAAIYLDASSRSASSGRTRRTAGHRIPPYSALLRMGLAWHAACAAPGGLLPRLFTLTLRPSDRGRYLFCGAVPQLAPAGRYPASCPAEPGLSSAPKRSGRLNCSLSLYHEQEGASNKSQRSGSRLRCRIPCI